MDRYLAVNFKIGALSHFGCCLCLALAAIAYSPGAAFAVDDCNSNGIPDYCDIDAQASGCGAYCGGNPSPCGQEDDCNGNEVPDVCDENIAATQADRCVPAEFIRPLASGLVFSGDTTGLGPEGSTTCGGPSANGSSSVHYKYKPDQDGTLTVTLCCLYA